MKLTKYSDQMQKNFDISCIILKLCVDTKFQVHILQFSACVCVCVCVCSMPALSYFTRLSAIALSLSTYVGVTRIGCETPFAKVWSHFFGLLLFISGETRSLFRHCLRKGSLLLCYHGSAYSKHVTIYYQGNLEIQWQHHSYFLFWG
jgi:hypothetical protein